MHLFLRQSIDSCLSCQFRLFFFYAVHHGALVRHSCCCTVLGVLWIPVEDYGCITFHAQSTAAPHFILTVKSDVVHLIVVCWVLLLQSFVAERIVHTRWPTDLFVHALSEVKPVSSLLCASIPATKCRWLLCCLPV